MGNNEKEQDLPVVWVLTAWGLDYDGSNSGSDRVVAASFTKQGLLPVVKFELDMAAKSVYCKMSKEQNKQYLAALGSNDVDTIVQTWDTMRCHAYGLTLEITAHRLVG